MKMEEFDRKLENLADYVSRVEQIDLWPVQGTDRKKLYGNIKSFFDKEKNNLGLKLLYEIEASNSGARDRFSYYEFKYCKSLEIDVLESYDSPAIVVRSYKEENVEEKAYFLLNQLKENLGVELSLKRKI